MRLKKYLLSAAMLALVQVAAGQSAALAEQDEPEHLFHSKPAPVKAFPLPSDRVHNPPLAFPQPQPPGTDDSWFLTFPSAAVPRLDTPKSACAYYTAIGAVAGCMPDGTFMTPVTFKKWKQDVMIGHRSGDHSGRTEIRGGGDDTLEDQIVQEDVAHFINQVDLNLTRDHHMIAHAPDNLAAYVCNHKGPAITTEDPTGLFPTQPEIDGLIRSIKQKSTLVACVAMEFSNRSSPADPAFTKFWIFDAAGQLTAGVDLDCRGDKFVPNVCTACHGGNFDSYNESVGGTQQFSRSKSAKGDLKAHFLPFDIANFAFASNVLPAQQETAIFALNRHVYDTELTRVASSSPSPGSQSITQLIKGWYGDLTENNVKPHFDRTFIAPKWKGTASQGVYENVVAHSCRTCHVAMDSFPFEIEPPAAVSGSSTQICTAHDMPNSKVTFDRFWLSGQTIPHVPGQPAGTLNQPVLLKTLISPNAPCNPP